MPKTFTEKERKYIRKRLIDEAKICLTQYGVKKTTVDELVKRANISKGTFYIFYKSKELLFFDVLCILHDEIQEYILSKIRFMGKNVDADKLTELLFDLYKKFENNYMLNFAVNGELELLIRKLPDDTADKHAKIDDLKVEQIIFLLPDMKIKNIKAVSAALRGIFLSMLHKHEIGDNIFDDALKIMIHGVVLQMFKGEYR